MILFEKIINFMFKFIGMVELIIAFLYLVNIVQVQNIKFSLSVHMIIVGLIFLFVSVNIPKNKIK